LRLASVLAEGPASVAGAPWWITILLGVATLALPTAAYFASTRATRLQVQQGAKDAAATREDNRLAVDAAAYERARQMYEAAIDVLKDQIEDLVARVASLSEEVHSLRSANEKLEKEVSKWRSSAERLTEELERIRGR
jgi:chromosome segregation ATPase